MISLPANVIQIMETLTNNGFAVYAVGGCVRDALLGKEPKDWDLATNARIGNLEDLFPDAKVISEKYSVIRRDFPKPPPLASTFVDVATFRTEDTYGDGRRPDRVHFVDTISEDLKRRDFTINAIAYGFSGLIVDPYGGERDLISGILRCIGDPVERFTENPIRMLRGARIAAEYDFMPEEQTKAAMTTCAGLLHRAGADRIRTDFVRLLQAPSASLGLRILLETKMIEAVCGMNVATLGQDALDALAKLAGTIDETPPDEEMRLVLFARCFDKDMLTAIIKILNFDKKTRKRLVSNLTEESCS